MSYDPDPVRYSALCLTHRCNLRCSYCYAAEGGARMSATTARRAVDFLVDSGGGSSTITFFGGEPLTEFSLIEEIVGYANRNYGSAVQFRMSTNGTLLDENSLRFLADHDIHFVLSLDGNRAQHDRHRTFADGSGSFDRILQVVPQVLQANPYTLAVSVVSPDTAAMISEGVQSLFAQGFRYVLQTLDSYLDN